MTKTVGMLVLIGMLTASAIPLFGAPAVLNPSFEADRYGVRPGYAGGNGGAIVGWSWQGPAGINPCYADTEARRGPFAPFADNGRIPDGRQVAFLQNASTLSQEIGGLTAGKSYVVRYRENARHNQRPTQRPAIEVRLGGQIIVSKHLVPQVEDFESHTLPYHLVESAPFVPPADGAYELVFRSEGTRVAVLLDMVTIIEGDPPAPELHARKD